MVPAVAVNSIASFGVFFVVAVAAVVDGQNTKITQERTTTTTKKLS